MSNGNSPLPRVFWIGGSTCAGKSTLADALAARHGLQVYHFDRQEPFHIYRSIPEEQPNLIRFMGRTMDERWVTRSPQEMASEVIACWRERFSMVLADLAHMAGDTAIIAEGAGFFPSLVAPLLSDPTHAVWLIARPSLIEHVRHSREPQTPIPHISDPEKRLRNIITRDILLAAHVRQEAIDRNLSVIDVDRPTIAGIAEALDPTIAAWLIRSHQIAARDP